MAAAIPTVLRLSTRDADDDRVGGGAPVPAAIPGPGGWAAAPGVDCG